MTILLTIWTAIKSFFGWFFKQDIKSIAIEVLSVAVIVLFLVLKFRKDEAPKIVYVNTTNQLDTLPAEKDANGQLYELLNEVTLSRDQLQAQVDSLSKALKISKSIVQTVTQIKTVTEVKDSAIQVLVDKHDNETFAFSDAYATMDVTIDSLKKAKFFLETVDTLTLTETLKKPFLGLFGSTEHNIYIRNQNPYNHVVAGNSYTVKEKQIWLTIGPSIEYDPITKKIDWGISVQYPLIKLKH